MNSLEMEVVKHTEKGGAHIKLNSDGDNLGFLYLSEEQYKTLKGVLTSGCLKNSVNFNLKNSFDTEDYINDDNPFVLDLYNEDNS